MSKLVLVFNNIKLPFNASVEEAFSVAIEKSKRLGVYNKCSKPYVYKRSVDARNKDAIVFVYSIAFHIEAFSINEKLLSKHGAILIAANKPQIEFGEDAKKFFGIHL